LKNNKGYFHVGAYDVPGDNSCVFGYFSDYRTIKLEAETSEAAYTSGDTIRIFMKNSEAFSDISWRKPDGSIVPGSSLTIMNATASDAGMYRLTANSKDGCTVSEAGYVVVNIFDPVTGLTDLCSGESTQLQSSGEGHMLEPCSSNNKYKKLMVSHLIVQHFLFRIRRRDKTYCSTGIFRMETIILSPITYMPVPELRVFLPQQAVIQFGVVPVISVANIMQFTIIVQVIRPMVVCLFLNVVQRWVLQFGGKRLM
jgi:hypothetical protein